MTNSDLGPLGSQADFDGFGNVRPRFSGHFNPYTVRKFTGCTAFVIRDISARHGFRRMPESVAAAKMKITIGRGDGMEFGELRQHVAFASRREPQDTRGIG